MKSRTSVVIAAGAALCSLSMGLESTAFATELRTDYSFDLEPGACVAEGSAVALDQCVPWGDGLKALRRELHPVVPVELARVLLPEGEELASVEFRAEGEGELAYRPAIAGRQRPLSRVKDPRHSVPAWDGAAYPAAWHGEAVVRSFRGHAIIEMPLFPLRYLGDGRAAYITGGTLVVKTKAGATLRSELRRDVERDRLEALSRVDNGQGPWRATDEAEGYLVIGASALIGDGGDASPLKPLLDSKRARGLTVEVATLETVSPSKDPAQIRAYIKTRYQAGAIDYVLLVGDQGKLPWKKIRSGVSDSSDPIPSDQYYACLDGDFSTGGTASYDWACEVAVGRVGAKTAADVTAWVAKTLALEQAVREGRTGSVVNFGEKLDSSSLGSWSMDWLINGRDVAPSTTPFPTTTQFTKLYDTFSSTVSATTFINTLNAGDVHIVNHLGHANTTYVFRMNASDITRFTSRPAFYYSQGCYPNDPDTDNWTIRATRAPSYGPAAMISNTRYGWYEPGQGGEGTSAMLHRVFWSQRFAGGVKQLGKMNHRAKEVAVGADTSSLMKYTALESNLIGDPELDLGN
jgi:hypothetical protein